MNDQNSGNSPALTTVEEALSAQGRAETLAQFARLAMGQPEAKAEAQGENQGGGTTQPETAEAATETIAKTEDDLSQSKAQEEGTEAKPETEAQAAEQAETPEVEDELAGKLDEHTQQAINKRIAKEVAKTKAEREQREAMEQQLAELKQKLEQQPKTEPQGVRNPVNHPLANVMDAQALQAEAAKARQALKDAEELLDTLEDAPDRVEAALRQGNVKLTGADGMEDYSVTQMRQFLKGVRRNARQFVEEAIPQRAQYLDVAAKAQAKAQELMPELKDPKSSRSQKFQQVLAAFPELKSLAEYPVAAAVQVLGLEALEAQLKAKQAPAPPKAKPPLPTKIPQPKATAPSVPKPKPGTVSDETYERAINGDKNARRQVIQSLVPKFT